MIIIVKVQEKDERSFPQNTDSDKSKKMPLYTKLYTKINPQPSRTFESQTASQLSCIPLSGTPLKATVQEAHREEQLNPYLFYILNGILYLICFSILFQSEMETTISDCPYFLLNNVCYQNSINIPESSLQVDKNLSFLDSYVERSLEQGAQPYIPENERSGMINISNFRSQDQHDTSTHTLRFEAYELPKTSAPPRISPVSLAPSTELVPVPEPSYPVEMHHVASVPSVSDTGSTELRLRLDGVQKKWGRPTYSSPASSSSDSTSHKAVNGVTQSDVSSTSTSRTRDSSYDSRSAQAEISSEKKKLAASLFGGPSKTEKRPSSTSHKVARSTSPAVEKSQGPKAVASSTTGVVSEKAAPLQPPPDLLDLGEPTVTSSAPSVDPFKQLEGLLDPTQATSAASHGAVDNTKAADIMSMYSEFPTSGQSSVIANPVPTSAGDANLIPGLSTTNKTGHAKGPNPRDALEKDALVRQMGVTPMSQNPNLFKDLLG